MTGIHNSRYDTESGQEAEGSHLTCKQEAEGEWKWGKAINSQSPRPGMDILQQGPVSGKLHNLPK